MRVLKIWYQYKVGHLSPRARQGISQPYYTIFSVGRRSARGLSRHLLHMTYHTGHEITHTPGKKNHSRFFPELEEGRGGAHTEVMAAFANMSSR